MPVTGQSASGRLPPVPLLGCNLAVEARELHVILLVRQFLDQDAELDFAQGALAVVALQSE